MDIIGEVIERKERPPVVRFERVPLEDKHKSIELGRYVAKDVDFAFVTPPYSKDVFKQKAEDWFKQLKSDMESGRIPEEWVEMYKEKYARWQKGQEMPLNGTPIKGWGVISPAQQETLIRMHVLTVEDLSMMNDEGIRHIGMGGMDMKNKAKAWLAQLNDKGKFTQEMAALQQENMHLRNSVEKLESMVANLKIKIENSTESTVEAPTDISVSDILDPVVITEAPKRRGRPPKVKQ